MQFKKYNKKIGDFLIGKTIGQGTFGKVKQGIHMPSGKKVAIKILQKNKISIKDDLKRVHNQLTILYNKVDHPNIIKLLQLHESPTSVYIVTEYIQGKQLYQVIVQNGSLSAQMCGIYFSQLVNAVSYLHSIGICHRDIKPENIMVNGNNLKLIDFGLSKQFGSDLMLETSCGSPCYAAPEMVNGGQYDCVKTDIWAMGVTLYAMAAGCLPFEHQNTQRLYQLVNKGNYTPIKTMSNTPQPQLNHINNIISSMLQTSPTIRSSLTQLKNPWIKKYQQYIKTNIQSQYENDEILLKSMSKYFYKSIQQIKQIIKNKQIVSICTYYYLNRRYKINIKQNKSRSLSIKLRGQVGNIGNKQLKRYNSPNLIRKINQSNPESNHKKPINFNDITNNTPKMGQKNKSLTLSSPQASQIYKQILQQIHKNQKIQNPLSQSQKHQPNKQQTLSSTPSCQQIQQQQPQIHTTAFHLNYIFKNLQQVYSYIQNQLSLPNIKQKQDQHNRNRPNNNKFTFISNRIQQQSQQQFEQQQQLANKYINNPIQQQIQQQYIVYNNKYILQTHPKPKYSSSFQSKQQIKQYAYNKNINKLSQKLCNNKRISDNQIKYISKYVVQYKGIILRIKILENMGNMYYLQLPAYFCI